MVNCILCNNNQSERLFEKYGYQLVRCRFDGHIYVSNPPNLEELSSLYSQEYFEGKLKIGYRHNLFEDVDMQLKRSEKRVKKIKRFLDKGKVLDVGCGPGFFVFTASKEFEIEGVDVSKAAVEYAKAKFGIDIWLGDFLDYPENNEYDVITMFSHLEHTINPRRNLEKARCLLNPDGLIILSLPNIDGIPRHLQGRMWRGFSFPEHLHFFNEDSLRKLLKETGFLPIKSNFLENNILRDTNYFYAVKV